MRRVKPRALLLGFNVVVQGGHLDNEVLAFIRDARAGGKPVGLATNATDGLPAELALPGLEKEFDVVLGLYQPTREFFSAACEALSVPTKECFFVDDGARNVMGARAAGLPAIRWTGHSELPYLRAVMTAGDGSPA